MNGNTEFFDSSEFAIRATLEDTHYWHVHRRAVLLEALRAFAPPASAGRLIELGCGIGTVATFLNQNGYVVDYGDYFQDAVTIARQRASRKLRPTDVADRRFLKVDLTQPLTMSGYHGALLLDVIEHLPDDELVLRHVQQMLSPDGFVMVTVPAFDFLWSPWDDVEKHKRRYTDAQLVAVLERSGFAVEHATYVFAPLFFAALGMKGVRRLKGIFSSRHADHMSDLTESKNIEALNRVVLGAHLPERKWLARNRRLPFGTSVLALARRRG